MFPQSFHFKAKFGVYIYPTPSEEQDATQS